ncbi:MAG TPA: hypothetical protein VLW50_26280 [Streptosporangiaceae bacterium]|nr:hypothetical protein [Streptosporangiaceae bacterium]
MSDVCKGSANKEVSHRDPGGTPLNTGPARSLELGHHRMTGPGEQAREAPSAQAGSNHRGRAHEYREGGLPGS